MYKQEIYAGMDHAPRQGQESGYVRGEPPALDLPDWNEALKLRAPGEGLGHGFARTPAKASFKLGPPQVAAPSKASNQQRRLTTAQHLVLPSNSAAGSVTSSKPRLHHLSSISGALTSARLGGRGRR